MASQVWVTAELDAGGHLHFAADSDSQLTRGLAWILVNGLSGLTPDEVAEVRLVLSASHEASLHAPQASMDT